jgi:hypothetical protein
VIRDGPPGSGGQPGFRAVSGQVSNPPVTGFIPGPLCYVRTPHWEAGKPRQSQCARGLELHVAFLPCSVLPGNMLDLEML